MAAAVVNGIIYIMGGNYSQRNCQAYDPSTNTWEERAPIPVGGGGWVHSATAYNGLIYVFGGSTYSPWAPLKTVYAYDPQTDTWAQKKDMPTPRFAVGTYLVDGRIYVMGGSQGSNSAVATVEVYDPVDDTWDTLANMPQSLLMFAGATVHGRLYVIGGTSDWATSRTDVWECDPFFHMDGSWTQKPSMPLHGGSACEVRGKIYVMGGAGGEPGYSDLATNEVYDPLTDTWEQRTPDGSLPH